MLYKYVFSIIFTIILGGLADDHDVLHFLTTSLHFIENRNEDENKISSDEIKLSEEYQTYQKKLEEQKENYRRYFSCLFY